MTLIGWAICGLASFILLVAALGVIRLPDALARQHAATKAATLAVSLFASGLALVAWDAGWGWTWLWRLLAIVAILLLTLPLASHGLARAGVMEREHLEPNPRGTPDTLTSHTDEPTEPDLNPLPDNPTQRLSGDLPADIVRAVEILQAGGLVAMPTETVYGLGADAANDQAVARIFEAKGRPADHPLIVHIASASEMTRWARDVPETAWQLAGAFWPGPLTLILKRASGMAEAASGGLDTIGLRVPGHPVARALLATFKGGIAAPSANRFGRISPTSAEHVLAELGGRIDAVVDGGVCSVGLESTILDLSGDRPRMLRPGAVTTDMLVQVIGGLDRVEKNLLPKAPGMLDAHYAPATPLCLVPSHLIEAEAVRQAANGEVIVLARGRAGSVERCRWMQLPDDAARFGHELYARLREADAQGARVILVETPPPGPEWDAVNDRLRRAATGSGMTESA